MKSDYPQVLSPHHANGHAAQWQLQQAMQRIAELEVLYAKERLRADEWRQLFIIAAAFMVFMFCVLLAAWGWGL